MQQKEAFSEWDKWILIRMVNNDLKITTAMMKANLTDYQSSCFKVNDYSNSQ